MSEFKSRTSSSIFQAFLYCGPRSGISISSFIWILFCIYGVKKRSSVHISYRMRPSAKTSVGNEYDSCFICSGEKYSLVPTMLCVRVIYSISLHRPMSAMIGTGWFVSGSLSMKTLSGLRSLCIIFLSCRYCTPSHIYLNNVNTNFSGIFDPFSLNLFNISVNVPSLAYQVMMHKQFSYSKLSLY